MSATQAYLEHVAIHVRDIAPHIAFFRDVLDMTITQLDGDPAAPRQVWLLGGIQLIEDSSFVGPEGRCSHLGIVCADVPAAIEAAIANGAKTTAKGAHWLELPDGLLLEFLPEKKDAVRIVRDLDPRI
ncbi:MULTISPECIES: VOC family protein [Alphaproteobacteria]|uniref:Glyoxalase n=2 Tax=Alphaproteobacteria TaxID=28211 RepID=A0A512HH06_9HYPH|nr:MULTISPECIES: VOC family protein [Alphaproteobacteria]GEO84737.1 glyoxalase [Ciceribacter naphthalenivorans]GLR20642.1 glyoxalase [Ciceribacter naphthalenivorans]GLT03498.1 glyoxalase [Sphingomonas psychrolutea]